MNELDVMTRTLWGEARGEDDEGVLGVAWTIRNRADNPRWWGTDIESVCLKRWQFSCWNPTDPNYPYMIGRRNIPSGQYIRCREIALQALQGTQPDPTFGATHYHVKGMKNPPRWRLGADVSAIIGHHVFYRNVP